MKTNGTGYYGARILWETPINVPILGQLKISETMVVSWLVMLLITGVHLAHP
ncbi:MAG: hypothetical protein ACLR2E_09900 [Lachnospiraceae bacterium]